MIFGLVNNGNTCYFNAGIQSLIHIPEFYNCILTPQVWINGLRRNIKLIYEELIKLVLISTKSMLENNNNVKNPFNIHKNIVKYHYTKNEKTYYPYMNEFSIGRQFDSYDLIIAYINIIHEETKISIDIPITNLIYYQKYEELHNKDINTDIIEYNRDNMIFFGIKFIKDIFGKEFSFIRKFITNEYVSVTECETCGHKSFSFSLSESLEINIDDSIKSDSTELLTLTDYMDQQISHIKYSENNYHHVDTGHLNAYNIMKFWNCPKILIIRLKRFVTLPNGKNIKITKPIEIPEFIDMDKYIHKYNFNENKPHKYKLISAIQHDGSINGGHYYCYSNVNNIWYNFNDTRVFKFNSIPNLSQSYVLIYNKLSYINKKNEN
jgi:ubiquitin C-terminal hydrolase